MNSNQSFCLGARHYSQALNQKVYEKKNPKTNKFVKIIKENSSTCGRNKAKYFTK